MENKMTKVLIYGASDDLVEVEGDIVGADEFDVYGPWEADLVHVNEDGDESSLRISAEYGSGPGNLEWNISVSAVNSYPAWPVTFGERPDREGDPSVTIEVPEGSFLRVLTGRE